MCRHHEPKRISRQHRPLQTSRCPGSPVPSFWRQAPWLALSRWSCRLALRPVSPECITTRHPSSHGKGQHPPPLCTVLSPRRLPLLRLCSAAVFAVVVPCYIHAPCVTHGAELCAAWGCERFSSPSLAGGSAALAPVLSTQPLARQFSRVGRSLFPCVFGLGFGVFLLFCQISCCLSPLYQPWTFHLPALLHAPALPFPVPFPSPPVLGTLGILPLQCDCG